MATEADSKKLFKYSPELKSYRSISHCMFYNYEAIVKDYSVSSHRNIDLILKIKKKQIITEAKAILKCKTIGIAVPSLYLIDTKNYKIIMENVSGIPVSTFLKENDNNSKAITGVLFEIGVILSKLHKSNISHGDLNTSNMLIKENDSIVLINFGLSCLNPSINEKVMDLYILEQSFINVHWEIANKFWLIFTSYKEMNETIFPVIFEKFNQLKTTIMMVNSTSENQISHYTCLGTKNELTPSRYKNADEILSKNNDLLSHSPKKKSPKSVTQINTKVKKSSVETKMNDIENNIFPLGELKLSLKRIDESNYISILSPHSLKIYEENKQRSNLNIPTSSKNNLKKSQQLSEPYENNELHLVEGLVICDDTDKLFNSSKKCSKKNSVLLSHPISLDDEVIIQDYVSPKRSRKVTESTSHSNNFNEVSDITKRTTRQTVNGFEKLAYTSDIEVKNIIENKRKRKTSVFTPSKSRNSINELEPVTSNRTRKSINRIGNPADISKIDMPSISPIKIHAEKIPSSSYSNDSDSEVDTLKYVTPKRTTRQSVNGFGKLADTSDIEVANIIENKRTRKTSISTPSKSRNNINELKPVTSKRISKTIDRFGKPVDISKIDFSSISPKKRDAEKMSLFFYSNDSDSESDALKSVTPKRTTRNSVHQSGELACSKDIQVVNTKKHTRRKSVTTPCKSRNLINSLESVTPKRARKSIGEFEKSVDLSDTGIENTPKSYKRSRIMSVNNRDEDLDFENECKTPVNKHNRLSYTPTTHSGSKVRRSILPYIPENKEMDVVSTPKTPKNTPKTHVKNLTASVSKRLDCGVRVPCSPLEKARANLHLHAAPKHLPCREVEFKSIHSFLARKINDELTGSMYISGVPGTGKTATVKRVIDSLNTDLIMKHSFKFIEINGLKLANPHQAFSVIWKGLTAETVSSSRAQVLLDNYFSGNEVRELSTILLVDEVDHICNRKQDVVYNILDWPSRTGSKVVVITIANTMDLPERVLRGCVTSRMGLTRLVFKPYTFQQLQEIIMNRLIGNSSFDPDAVQLVARKVAAVSGDARRALDICRRAIDLIKDDDTQLITINHVNQVLNSILTGVRVTAIRYCSLFEQFFLRALRDETTRTGFDHSTIYSIHNHMKSICLLEGEELPNDQQVVMMAYRLRDNGLIFLEKKRWDLFRKVSLNVSSEDISYALDKYYN